MAEFVRREKGGQGGSGPSDLMIVYDYGWAGRVCKHWLVLI